MVILKLLFIIVKNAPKNVPSVQKVLYFVRLALELEYLPQFAGVQVDILITQIKNANNVMPLVKIAIFLVVCHVLQIELVL
jgi:hypothetical protein